jgi:hypothetical protein
MRSDHHFFLATLTLFAGAVLGVGVLAAPPTPDDSTTPSGEGPRATSPAPEIRLPRGVELPEGIPQDPRTRRNRAPALPSALPPGAGVPRGIETRRYAPHIDDFMVETVPDCFDGRHTPIVILADVFNYKIAEIRAVLDSGATRRVFRREWPEMRAAANEEIEDREWVPGQVAYELVATGEHGAQATRRAAFRTPGTFNVTFDTAFVEVIDLAHAEPGRSDRYGSHFEARIHAHPADRVTRVAVEPRDRDGHTTTLSRALSITLNGDTLRTESRLWDSHGYTRRFLADFDVSFWYRRDPCPGEAALTKRVLVVHAE